ncbi:uncharacterized protein Dwil_GK17982 [Drosophila willistoni]|uniref:Peptidase S1 domain-containing protein n=2 Tax=Drosophila willistoni TaxID=7260 RepID=B4N614_DROWI|nr:uncharacterized protein Dwil_GK17982 [Drosophila willistoni]
MLRTIGGQISGPGQVPYVVALTLNGFRHCGGALISETIVLTAAHCTWGYQPSQMNVIAGINDLNSLVGQVLDVAELINHSQFIPGQWDYDIALVRLSSPVKFDGKVQKIPLADSDSEYPGNKVGTVSGFGAINKKLDVQTFLRSAQVPIWGRLYCNKIIPDIMDRKLCAGNRSGLVGACQGDSGGPLSVDGKLFGVVSWGYNCGTAGEPSVYSYVPAYRSWIYLNSQV